MITRPIHDHTHTYNHRNVQNLKRATIVFTSNMITTRRQISALSNLLYTRAKDVVLGHSIQQQPTTSFVTWGNSHISPSFVKKFQEMYNSSQLDAICAAAGSRASTFRNSTDSTKFALIQGPPGTGKTHTIVGLLNATHVADYNQYYEFLEKSIFDGLNGRVEYISNVLVRQGTLQNSTRFVDSVVSRMDGEFTNTHLMAVSKRPRILIVAPSNAAVDVIVKRIMENGFLDGRCGRYRPRIVRLGTFVFE